MATPIFVLGAHRSGTTWIANLLCEHPLIAGIRHERHHGVHESAYFSRIHGRFGDLAVRSNHIEFAEVVAASDYFRLAEVDRSALHALWPTTYEDAFRAVMDRFAERRHAAFWLEKSPSHSPLARTLARWYPDARFIIIRRAVPAVAASAIGLAARRAPGGRLGRWTRRRALVRTALAWGCYTRILESFAASCPRALVVHYESLRADVSGELARICDFLGIRFDSRVCESAHPPNTSFRSPGERRHALSTTERAVARAAGNLPRLAPVRVLEALGAAWRRVNRRRALPGWFFALLESPLAAAGEPAPRRDDVLHSR